MQLGDVMLVKGKTFTSSTLSTIQKVIYANSKSSHVLFCLGDGCFMHSTGDGGVHLRFVLDELEEIKEDWRVIRLKHLPNSKKEQLRIAGMYFLDQSYNKKFLISGSPHGAFCSELVGKICQKANVAIIGNRAPHKLTPAHFDKEADRECMWSDVTEECKQFLKDHEHLEKEHRFMFDSLNMHLRGNKSFGEMRRYGLDLIKSIDADLGSKIDSLYEDSQTKVKVKFWDQP